MIACTAVDGYGCATDTITKLEVSLLEVWLLLAAAAAAACKNGAASLASATIVVSSNRL